MPQIVMQRKNEKTGRPKDAQPLTMPTQENLKIKITLKKVIKKYVPRRIKMIIKKIM